MTTTTGQAQYTIRRLLDEKRQQSGALLAILHTIQDELSHVPLEAVAPKPVR